MGLGGSIAPVIPRVEHLRHHNERGSATVPGGAGLQTPTGGGEAQGTTEGKGREKGS